MPLSLRVLMMDRCAIGPAAVTGGCVQFGPMAPFILPACKASLTEPEPCSEKQVVLDLAPGHPLVTITMPCGFTALEHFRELAAGSMEAGSLFQAIWRLLELMHAAKFYHFDAKINNMVLYEGAREGAVQVQGTQYWLYMIDFETALWSVATPP